MSCTAIRTTTFPSSQARTMRKLLADFHADFVYYERPGAGHWWGNPCVDWPPMFDFFQRHTLPAPAEVRTVEFVTANPGVSAWMHWAGIEGQQQAGKFSTVKLRLDDNPPRLSGTTANVFRLAIDVGHLKKPDTIAVELDGQKLEGVKPAVKGSRIWLQRDGDKWSAAPPLPPAAQDAGALRPLPRRLSPAHAVRLRHQGQAGRKRLGAGQGPLRRRNVLVSRQRRDRRRSPTPTSTRPANPIAA